MVGFFHVWHEQRVGGAGVELVIWVLIIIVDILQDAERYFRAIQISSLCPTIVTYTNFMDALSEAGQVETMLSLLYEMVENRIKPNVVTYSVIIRQ
jgi:pentatricopeptide repeat protein